MWALFPILGVKSPKGGSITVGGGDHNLNFQRFHNAITGAYGDSNDWTWGAEIESSAPKVTVLFPMGDHSFARTSGRIQLVGPDSQTDLFFGYQDKFYGWPAMYTGNVGELRIRRFGYSTILFKSYP